MSGLVNDQPIISLPCSQALERYLRVTYDATYGLGLAGPEDVELGTTNNRHIVSGLGSSSKAAIVAANATGIRYMIAAGALSAFDTVFGAEDGKVDDTPNANPQGITLTAATADGDVIEVLSLPGLSTSDAREFGGLDLYDDFLGDYPAAATALNDGPWTKVETNGLGVISSDEANGVLIFGADTTSEAATAALYMANAPFDIDQNPIFTCRAVIFDKGDAAAVDFNWGVASDTHATDFDSITNYVAFHVDGNTLDLKVQSADGATTVAAVDTTVDIVDDTYMDFMIDLTDTSDAKFYYKAISADQWTRILASTTFDMSNYTGTLTPIFHVAKTTSTSPFDFRLDVTRTRAERLQA